MPTLNEKKMFPCPVCADPCEVRLSKKNKPYIVCDPCGVQVFVRGPAGIAAFTQLAEQAEVEDVWSRISELEKRYRLKCPECGCRFWIERELIETSGWDGSLKGFRCPGRHCDAIVAWGKK